ncbi:hypothetical protein ACFFX0_22010 [Citricoccus parietis]|uniref:Uncharacterized protein n=1 Tax=Citricoccus parietis TaxID=592307 RepID=A0ABV5G462_9MICC
MSATVNLLGGADGTSGSFTRPVASFMVRLLPRSVCASSCKYATTNTGLQLSHTLWPPLTLDRATTCDSVAGVAGLRSRSRRAASSPQRAWPRP